MKTKKNYRVWLINKKDEKFFYVDSISEAKLVANSWSLFDHNGYGIEVYIDGRGWYEWESDGRFSGDFTYDELRRADAPVDSEKEVFLKRYLVKLLLEMKNAQWPVTDYLVDVIRRDLENIFIPQTERLYKHCFLYAANLCEFQLNAAVKEALGL
jgi:hypothetical protein